MHFANINGRAAIVDGDRYQDLNGATDGQLPHAPGEFLFRWEETLAAARQLRTSGGWQPIGEATVGAPVPFPRQSIGVGLNYVDHVVESGHTVPEIPLIFAKLTGSLSGPNDDVLLPSECVDWEAELVVVIGAAADRITAEQGQRAIAGFMVGQDFSERRVQRQPPGAQHTLGKSFRTFGPTGPALVTLDEFTNPFDLAISCTVNGEIVQSARTSEMLVGVGQLIAMLSTRFPLGPGDLIFTGTPAGIGSTRNPPRFLRPGDVVQTEIEGVGRITNRCVADPGHAASLRGANQ